MKAEYREARCDDAAGVYEVEKQSFDTPWSFESIYYDLCTNPVAHYVVAETGGRIAGFAGLHAIVGEGHITNIAVLPGFRGKGVGRMLLQTLLSQNSQLISYTLEVRVSNAAAIALYESFGFTQCGIRPRYYADNGEDAVIMWRNRG